MRYYSINHFPLFDATTFVHVCPIFTDLYVGRHLFSFMLLFLSKYYETTVICYSYSVHNAGLF
jgi:hypothetical protein